MPTIDCAVRQTASACVLLLLVVPALGAQPPNQARSEVLPAARSMERALIMPARDGSARDQGDATATNPVADAARARFPEHRRNIVAAFESMPAEKYTSRPMPALMSFGEFAIHIASANVYYCRRLGATAPVPAWLKPTAPKEQLVKLLDETFEYCAPVLAQLNDASLGANAAPLPNGKETGTRAQALLDLIAGLDHHYGQAAAYLRMNGIVPPTAVEKKQP